MKGIFILTGSYFKTPEVSRPDRNCIEESPPNITHIQGRGPRPGESGFDLARRADRILFVEDTGTVWLVKDRWLEEALPKKLLEVPQRDLYKEIMTLPHNRYNCPGCPNHD